MRIVPSPQQGPEMPSDSFRASSDRHSKGVVHLLPETASNYSVRNVSMGSIRVSRRAGIRLAAPATSMSRPTPRQARQREDDQIFAVARVVIDPAFEFPDVDRSNNEWRRREP
jgi:hypothetical protein